MLGVNFLFVCTGLAFLLLFAWCQHVFRCYIVFICVCVCICVCVLSLKLFSSLSSPKTRWKQSPVNDFHNTQWSLGSSRHIHVTEYMTTKQHCIIIQTFFRLLLVQNGNNGGNIQSVIYETTVRENYRKYGQVFCLWSLSLSGGSLPVSHIPAPPWEAAKAFLYYVFRKLVRNENNIQSLSECSLNK